MKKHFFLISLLAVICRLALADGSPPSPCKAFSYATAANDVYKNHPPHPIGCAGHQVASSQSDGSGFYAEIYGDAQSGFVIAFRGTQETQDWVDDMLQGLNGNQQLNEQFAEAADYMAHIMDVMANCFPGAKKTITGHSLGGALAQYAATLAGDGYQTATYNPAGLLPDYADINNAKSVNNYVHGNEILYWVVNPLLQRLKANGCSGVASGYVGDTIKLTPGQPINFDGLNIDCNGLNEIVGALQDLNTALANWGQASLLQKASVLTKLGTILKNDDFQKILAAVAPAAAEAWKQLTQTWAAQPPANTPWWDIMGKAQWDIDHTHKLINEADDFFNKLKASISDIGSSGADHMLGEISGEPGHYKDGSVLGVLQKNCKDSGGIPTIYGGYPAVPGGCFGGLPQTDGRPADFLDRMGQAIQESGDTLQAALGADDTALKILDAFGKNAGPLADVVGILSSSAKFAEVSDRCTLALASGSKQDFVNAINDGLKFAVNKLAEAGGTTLGAVVGGPIGGIIGGWLGGTLGDAAYDKYLKDFVTHDIAETLFDLLCPNKGIEGIPTDPGSGGSNGGSGSGGNSGGSSGNGSGGSGQNGGSGSGGSGDSGGGGSGGGSTGAGSSSTSGAYKRDDNYKTISK